MTMWQPIRTFDDLKETMFFAKDAKRLTNHLAKLEVLLKEASEITNTLPVYVCKELGLEYNQLFAPVMKMESTHMKIWEAAFVSYERIETKSKPAVENSKEFKHKRYTSWSVDPDDLLEKSCRKIAEEHFSKEGIVCRIVNLYTGGTDGGHWCFSADVEVDDASLDNWDATFE